MDPSFADMLAESDALEQDLSTEIDLPLANDSARVRIADVACSLALEHWSAVRELLGIGLLPSAVVVHRAQFEALARSVWLTYAATDGQIAKLEPNLSLESEQGAKNLPQVADMLSQIERKGPPQAHAALVGFKDGAWKALNSYAHAGLHPIKRHQDGYPLGMFENILKNANGLAVMTCMQAVVLGGEQPRQRRVLELAAKRSTCMPPKL